MANGSINKGSFPGPFPEEHDVYKYMRPIYPEVAFSPAVNNTWKLEPWERGK
jgi:hypothetical protein